MEASADSSAYCVAENERLHSAISSATKAAVPMPPQRFSMPMASAMVHKCCGVTASTQ